MNSTRILDLVGDDGWVHLRRWHDTAMRAFFAAHPGEEVKHTGDGFFVAFATGAAAIDCAIAIQRSLAEHRRLSGFAPQVRVGIHAADARTAGNDYQGAGVHVAARIASAAGGDEILVSRPTALVAGVSAGEVRILSLKGIPEPVEVVSIPW